MTREYLVGELSLILGELQAAAMNDVAVRDVARLRREAETTAPVTLGQVVEEAVDLIDRVCWDSLGRGETAAFIREVRVSAELWEFGFCAGFLAEAPTRSGSGAN
jgi:hypothetical protein